MVADKVAVQELKSVTVTVYVPKTTFCKSSMVEASDHKKVNGLVPPDAVIKISPVASPKQFTLVMEFKTTDGPVVLETVCDADDVHPLLSVTVTVKVDAERLIAV